jgi:hypothetical protein
MRSRIYRKIFIIILTGISFVSGFALSDPKDKLQLKPFKLNEIEDINNTECDLCGCYMGIDPNYHKNLVGIRFHQFKFFKAAEQEEGNITDNNGTNRVMHHSTNESTEFYNNAEIFARYYFNPKLRALISIPFSQNKIDGNNLSGFGDIKIIGQYAVYNPSIMTDTKFWQRLFIGGGVKLPTGSYNKEITTGEVEPHFQPGTGSLDLIFTVTHLAKLINNGFGMTNDIVYTANTQNKNNYQFANRFNITSTFFYEIPKGKFIILPHGGIYYESAGMDKLNGNYVDDSGGNILFGTAGIDLYYKNISLDVNIQGPLNQKLNGEQPENKYRFYTGIGYSF